MKKMAKKCTECEKVKKMAKGGSTSSFAKLAPPYDKVTFADKIAGAKKKMGSTLAKKAMGGDGTIAPKQIHMSVENNPQYKKSSITDPKTGNPIYTRKAGTGPMSAPAGSYAPSGTYAPNAVSKKAVIPSMSYNSKPISKNGGSTSAKKKMGGTTKAKKK